MSGRWQTVTFSRTRLIGVALIVVLAVLGLVLPYLTAVYVDATRNRVTSVLRAIATSQVLAEITPDDLPGRDESALTTRSFGMAMVAIAANLQWMAGLVAMVTAAGQFVDEVSKFFWWPLHLAGWVLTLQPVGLLVGLAVLQAQGVTIAPGPASVPAFAAGLVALAVTVGSRHRIDTYRGI